MLSLTSFIEVEQGVVGAATVVKILALLKLLLCYLSYRSLLFAHELD